MYKIYINETPLLLISNSELETAVYPRENVLITPYAGKKKFLLQYVDQIEKSKRFDAVVIHHNDVDELWDSFKSIFKEVKAGGGLVLNEDGKVLFIYRRGFWDLPKGKLDKGEDYKTAAVREVKEECGLVDLIREEGLLKTYHGFRNKDKKRILKVTKWYLMRTKDEKLVPQTEEDIEKAEWREIGEFLASGDECYKNIYDVLFTYFKNIK